MMMDKPVTLVVSDLHLGGGANDPGDDHVYQGDQFRRFIEQIEDSKEGQMGHIELFINGDFLEFAQVRPEVYTLGSAKYWCSERESMEKLDTILNGHPDIFAALKDFQGRGNQVTIAAGNHDVDLYWADVQKRIQEVAGPVGFQTGQDNYTRYEQRLVIGHGHMFDPANRFVHWNDPLLATKEGILRLEMCPGTLFMVKFVNWLEERYKFADNLKPITALARLLIKEERAGFAAAAWTLFAFTGSHPGNALRMDDHKLMEITPLGTQMADELAVNQEFLERITELYQSFIDASISQEKVKQQLRTDEAVTNFIKELILKVDPDQWMGVFDVLVEGTLGNPEENTLSIIRSGMAKDKEVLCEEAELQLATSSAEVVIFGHTHQPDEWRGVYGKSDGGYFNPGSWTRYVDVSKMAHLKLADLQNEEDFPYQLNYIRVEQSVSGKLRAEKICFEQASGARFQL